MHRLPLVHLWLHAALWLRGLMLTGEFGRACWLQRPVCLSLSKYSGRELRHAKAPRDYQLILARLPVPLSSGQINHAKKIATEELQQEHRRLQSLALLLLMLHLPLSLVIFVRCAWLGR